MQKKNNKKQKKNKKDTILRFKTVLKIIKRGFQF